MTWLHSDVDDLGARAKPPWFVRFGMLLVSAILTSFVFLAALISIPEQLRVPFRVAKDRASIAPRDGAIHFVVPDGSFVRAGQPVAMVTDNGSSHVVTVAHLPATFGGSLRPGDRVKIEIPRGRNVRHLTAQIHGLVPGGESGVDVLMIVPAITPAQGGMLVLEARRTSVLRSLITALRHR